MKRILFSTLLAAKLVMVPTHVLAQAVDTTSHPITTAEWALTGLMTVGSTADVMTTLENARNGGQEQNAMAAAFVSPKHPLGTYAFNVVRISAMTWLGHELKHSSSPVLRKLWWVPGVVFTSMSLYAANQNHQALLSYSGK